MRPLTINRHLPPRQPVVSRWVSLPLRVAASIVIGSAVLGGIGCGGPEYWRHGATSPDGAPDTGSGGGLGSGGALAATGGAPGSGAAPGSGGTPVATGGRGSGGAPSTGGSPATGGSSSGGAPGTGGVSSGGATGTGGAATGGNGSGGAATGGRGTGGAATGGAATGGAGTGGAPGDAARYNFETSAQGWMAAGTTAFTSVMRDTTRHYAGAAALAAALSVTSASTHQLRVTPDPTVPAGATVTAHVYIPSGSTVDWVQLYLQEGPPNYAWTGTAAPFTAGTWNTLTVTAPSSGAAIGSVGLQVHLTGSWSGTLYLDSVNW
jgi:hypothetical protein